MKFSLSGILCFLLYVSLGAQNAYFQQKVNYQIDMKLIDSIHQLEADQWMTYTNNAPEALEEIYFHLWPNAYKNPQTAYAKQQLQLHKTEFYFSEEEERGGYTSISFWLEGEEVRHENYEGHIDVVVLELPEPLLPGDSLRIRTQYTLQIPKTFSRLGRGAGSYQLTQWYPKPAVYDAEGWHPMPYLDQGEFYSEFGNFDVRFTLPEKYIVAATGTLQTKEELEFLKKKANRIKDLKDIAKMKAAKPDTLQKDSVRRMKTLHYTAKKVHDFALFLDDDYEIQYERFALPNGDSIDGWTFFTPAQITLWLQSLKYLKRAVQFYSSELGAYPYPQVTAVQGPLKAGAGMEYPMITVIGQASDDRSLDNVITHEVGHNWWYGILASNERKYPWLDEGINSSYEERYMEYYYPKVSLSLSDLTENRLTHEGRWVWEYQAQRHQDQAPNTPADEFTEINYFLGAYWKPAQSLMYLEDYVGPDRYREVMQAFYQKYKFRHYGPEDFKEHLSNAFDEDISWLFNGLIESDQEVDYQIKTVRRRGRNWLVVVKNQGTVEAPLSVGGFRYDSFFIDRYMNGFKGMRTFTIDGDEEVEAIRINVNEHLPEHDFSDNYRRVKNGKVRGKPVQLGFLVGLNNPYKRNLYLTPALGYNAYDGFQIGLWAHNVSFPGSNFEFSLLPNLGISSDQLAGLGDIRFRKFFNSRPGGISHISLGVGLRNYGYNDDETYGFIDRYKKVAPYVEVHGQTSALSFFDHYFRFRSVYIEQKYHRGTDISEGTFSTNFLDYWVHQLAYHFSSDHPIHPFQGKAQVEYITRAWRYTFHFDQQYQYQEGAFVDLSFFAGGISNYNRFNPDIRLYGTGQTGFGRFQKDYTFDRIMLGRNEREGLLAHQIFGRDAFLKTRANNIFSSSFMLGIGIRADLPIPNVPLAPYIDAVIYDDEISGQMETAFSSGIALSLFRKTFEVYFPLWESSNIRNSLIYEENPGYFNKITFSLNLQQWRVFDLQNQLNLF